MSYIAEIRLGRPLGQALSTVPDMVLQVEEVNSLPNEPWRFIFWASGDDFETYEAAINEDSSVASYTCLTELSNKRLYKSILSEEGKNNTVYPIVVEEDVTKIRLTMTCLVLPPSDSSLRHSYRYLPSD